MTRTREQDREYQRDYRKRKAVESHLLGGDVLRGRDEESLTSSVVLVQQELDSLPASRGLQSLVAAALAMARVLDDPSAVPQHPAAAGQLRQVMGEIRAARAPAAVSALSMVRGGRAG